jgi:hypothetical protein
MKASGAADVKSEIIKGRRHDCICERDGKARTVWFSEGRGYLIEDVECEDCWKAWKRFNP